MEVDERRGGQCCCLSRQPGSCESAPAVVELRKDLLCVGRQRECDIVLESPSYPRMISRRHASVFRDQQGRWLVRDEDSLNGVFVNGHKIKCHELRNGDEIIFGGRVGCVQGQECSTPIREFTYVFQDSSAALGSVLSISSGSSQTLDLRLSGSLGSIGGSSQVDTPLLGQAGTRRTHCDMSEDSREGLMDEDEVEAGQHLKRRKSEEGVDGGASGGSSSRRSSYEGAENGHFHRQALIFTGQNLGAGASARVQRAEYYGKPVAVKQLRASERNQRMFENELNLLKKCMCPHVLQLFGFYDSETQGEVNIVYEFMEGGSLEDLLYGRKDQPPVQLTLAQRLEIALQAALGVQYLHHCQPVIKHLDLKVGNVLVRDGPDRRDTEAGPELFYARTPQVKIADFGIARQTENLFEHTQTICGTPVYIAPEIVLNEPFSEKADVYSFGVMLWEIISVQRPYEQYCTDSMTKLYALWKSVISSDRRPDLDLLPPSLSGECLDILIRTMEECWQREPSSRPSMDSVTDSLKHALRLLQQEETNASEI